MLFYILGHKIYVLGGTDPKGEEVTNVEYFNTVTKKWKPSLKMSSGTYSLGRNQTLKKTDEYTTYLPQ